MVKVKGIISLSYCQPGLAGLGHGDRVMRHQCQSGSNQIVMIV